MKTTVELAPWALCRRFDPAEIPFATTAGGPAAVAMVGQPRAVAALQFGIGMARDGYNIFALGAPGTGKRTLTLRSLEEHAATRAVPPDLCYVYNFDDPRRPRLLRLPAGTGASLARAMDRLVEELRAAIAAALESEDYQRRRQALETEMKARPGQTLERIRARARRDGLDVLQTPTGLSVVAPRGGQVITEEEFQKLPEGERGVVRGKVAELEAELETMVRQIPRWLREHHDRLRVLRREVTALAAGHLVDEVRRNYTALPDVVAYLDAVQQDVVEHATELIEPEEPPRPFGRPVPARRYDVNVIVDQAGRAGAPVILEDHPTYENLIGRIEHLSQFGALVTDFTLIKAGALHRANGGYLVLDARDLLRAPFAWDAMKRALRSRRLRIETAGAALSLVDTVSLEPEPVALDVQVVLLGEPTVYYLLCALDPDFGELFKVAADFDDQVDADDEHRREYALLIAALVQKARLKPFDRGAVARVMEHSARVAGHQQKLSTRLSVLADLLAEADHWAGEDRVDTVAAVHVQRAIDEQLHRADRLRDRVYEEIARRTVMIDTAGARSGQVNGISVSLLGPLAFGRPTRITARARIGKGDVVDIEREVELGGPAHSKGVLILGAYLGARYSPNRPLSLSASLVFEQSYAPVEGDSASAAELFALLSAVANVPIRQCVGVTGSVNQHGEIQAVGAINEKIEGFFDVCRARGLTGEHGVVIPAANVQHLMLRHDVVDAVGRGLFHVYPIRTVDEGMTLLTGLPAPDRDASGEFPAGSLNRLVEARLVEFAETLPMFSGSSYTPV